MNVELILLYYVPKMADFGMFRPLGPEDISNYIFFSFCAFTYVHTSILVNIFSEVGRGLCELQGGARLLVAHDFCVIDSMPAKVHRALSGSLAFPDSENKVEHLNLKTTSDADRDTTSPSLSLQTTWNYHPRETLPLQLAQHSSPCSPSTT